jgi:hypothetical protein
MLGFAILCSVKKYRKFHRVDRVLRFFSSRPNWDSPTLLVGGEGGGTHSLEWLVTVPLSAFLGT